MKDNEIYEVRQLVSEIDDLANTGKASGFLAPKPTPYARSGHVTWKRTMSDYLEPPFASAQVPLSYQSLQMINDNRMKRIIELCSMKQYLALTECGYYSSKEMVNTLIETLTMLRDEGVFDNGNALPSLQSLPIPGFPPQLNPQPAPTQNPTANAPAPVAPKEGTNDKDDNSGKPYVGPVFTMTFTDGTSKKMVDNAAEIFHGMVNGQKDYINSNVIVSREPDENAASITVCINDAKDLDGIFKGIGSDITILRQLLKEHRELDNCDNKCKGKCDNCNN